MARVAAALLLAALVAPTAAAQPGATNHLDRARALENRGDVPAAIVGRLWADEALTRIDQRDHNQWQIWRLLQRLPESDLRQAPSGPWTTAGWWALARLHRQAGSDRWALAEALDQWERRFPDHPARDSVIRSLRVDLPRTDVRTHGANTGHVPLRPQRLALVLPTSGALAPAGNAIVDGLLEAARENGAVSYRLFDSGGGMTLGAYNAAARTGPDLIIGPLDRGAVEALTRRGHVPVPTLALNYGPRSAWSAGGLWQMGLSPEDDAEAAAQHALSEGKRRAAVLAADDDWGRRVAAAFVQRYESGGGYIVRESLFWPDSQESQSAVRALLRPESAEPLWRDDRPPRHDGSRQVDVLFLAAKSRDARLIVPLLRFHHAVDLPVYAPDAARGSRSDSEAQHDLAGVMICGARAQSKSHVDHANLRALGRDALLVSQQLATLTNGQVLDGASGQLHLGTGRQIRRQPPCGVIGRAGRS